MHSIKEELKKGLDKKPPKKSDKDDVGEQGYEKGLGELEDIISELPHLGENSKKVEQDKKESDEEGGTIGGVEVEGGVELKTEQVTDWITELTEEQISWWADPLRIGGYKTQAGESVDFINYYCQYMDSRTDACRLFKEACALFLISTMCKWNFEMWDHRNVDPFGRNEHVSGIPLNIWFFLMGKSRISRKTTCIDPVKRLVWKITDRKTISKKVGRKTREKNVSALLPDMFTPEALISTLNDRCWKREGSAGGIGKRTHAAWINDEISHFFEKLAKQDYMSGTPEALSKIYDCPQLYVHETIGRGEEKVENPYLTLLVASTMVLPTLFTQFQLAQGFLNRPFYIFDEKRDMKKIPINNVEDRWERIDEWVTALYNVRSRIKVLNDLIMKKYNKFEKRINRKIEKSDLGAVEGYVSMLPTFLLKLAALYRISRMGLEDFAKIGNREMPKYVDKWDWRWISDEDYKRALDFLLKCSQNFRKVVRMATIKTYKVPVQAIDATVHMVYEGIKDFYDQNKACPTGTELYNKLRARIPMKEYHSALQSLQAGENIELIQVKTKGRPVFKYKPLKEPEIKGF